MKIKVFIKQEWSPVFVSLEQKSLRCYLDSTKVAMILSVELQDAIIQPQLQNNEFCFECRTPTQSYLFRAHSQQEVNEWIEALQAQSNLQQTIKSKIQNSKHSKGFNLGVLLDQVNSNNLLQQFYSSLPELLTSLTKSKTFKLVPGKLYSVQNN